MFKKKNPKMKTSPEVHSNTHLVEKISSSETLLWQHPNLTRFRCFVSTNRNFYNEKPVKYENACTQCSPCNGAPKQGTDRWINKQYGAIPTLAKSTQGVVT